MARILQFPKRKIIMLLPGGYRRVCYSFAEMYAEYGKWLKSRKPKQAS